MAFDRGEIALQSKVKIRFADIVPPLELEPGRLGGGPADHPRDHAGPRALQRDPAGRLPLRELRGRQEAARRDRQRPRRALHQGRGRRVAGRAQGHRLPLGHPLRCHRLDRRRRRRRPNKAEILAGYEAQAAKVQKQFERGLITDDERRQELIEIWTQASNEVGKAMETDFDQTQPDLHDGRLGCLRKHDADPSGRGHAWSGGQPEGRDHPAADQVELPRGPVRAGVLHLHARCPQGSGRHRAADRRLGLPDPSSGRRLAGRHHP